MSCKCHEGMPKFLALENVSRLKIVKINVVKQRPHIKIKLAARRLDAPGINLIQKRFTAEATRRFRWLKKQIYQKIVVDDCFGLKNNIHTLAFDPDQPRDEHGRWAAVFHDTVPKDLKPYFVKSSTDTSNGFTIARLAANFELRTGKLHNYNNDRWKDTVPVEKTKDVLHQMTTKYATTLSKEIVVYRGVDRKEESIINRKTQIVDKGHTYVTTSKKIADQYANKGSVFKIILPKGTKGAWGYTDQHEFILPRDSHFEKAGKNTLRLILGNMKRNADCYELVSDISVLEGHDVSDEARDEHGRWTSGGSTATSTYKTTKGMDKGVNEELVKLSGVKIIAPKESLDDMHEAIAHVASEKSIMPLFKGVTITVMDMPGRYGNMSGNNLYVSKQALKDDGPGFVATIIRHELEHKDLTAKKVPSPKQESRVRYVAGVFAQFRYVSMTKSNPRSAAGFKKGAIASGIKMNELVVNARDFAFNTTAKKVEGFMDWLQEQNDKGVLEIYLRSDRRKNVGRKAWEQVYIQSAYKKGMAMSDRELKKVGIKPSSLPNQPAFPVDYLFNQPTHADRVGLIYTRTYNELKGVTDAMDQAISRTLAQGLADGRSPNQIAVDLNDEVDGIGMYRSRLIARTEVMRAHHVASINTYREAGAHGVRVQAEFSTAGDDRVCEECSDLDGKIYTLDEAEGLIPVHPQCRCIVLPVLNEDDMVDEKDGSQSDEEQQQEDNTPEEPQADDEDMRE